MKLKISMCPVDKVRLNWVGWCALCGRWLRTTLYLWESDGLFELHDPGTLQACQLVLNLSHGINFFW